MAIQDMVHDDEWLREMHGAPRIGWAVYENGDAGEVEVERLVVWNTSFSGEPDWQVAEWRQRPGGGRSANRTEYFVDLDDVTISAMGVRRVYWRKRDAMADAVALIKENIAAWQENLKTVKTVL